MHHPMSPYDGWEGRLNHHRLFEPGFYPMNNPYGSSRQHDSSPYMSHRGAGFPHPDYFQMYDDHRYRCNRGCLDVHIGNDCYKHRRDQGGRDQGGRDQGGRDQGGRDQGGRDQGGRDQGVRDQGGRNQGGREQGGRDQGGPKSKGSWDSQLRAKRNERRHDSHCRTKNVNDIREDRSLLDVSKSLLWIPDSTKPLLLCPKPWKRPILNLPSVRKPCLCTGKFIGQAVLADYPNEGDHISRLISLRPLIHYKHCLCIIKTYVPNFCDECKLCQLPVSSEYPPQPIDKDCKCGGTLWQIIFENKSYIICSTCALVQQYTGEYTFKYFIDNGAFVKKCEETRAQEEKPDISSDSQENTWAEQVERTIDEEYDTELNVKKSSAVVGNEDVHSSSAKIPILCLGRMIGESIAEENGKQNILFSFLPFTPTTANIQRCTCLLKCITEAFCDKCYVCYSKEPVRAISVFCSCGGQLCVINSWDYTVCSRCGLHYHKTDISYFSQGRKQVKRDDKH